MDSLTDVAVFVEVVDSGTFTAAADKLELSKSVISKYVTRLEQRLGARLLNRTTRRLSLTEAGRVFYVRSRRGLQELEDAETEVAQLQSMPRGLLRLNAPMSFGILHVAPALPELLRRFPDLQVDMHLEDRKLDMIDEGYDLSIRIAELPDSSLVSRRLGTCRHAVVASPRYLAEHGTPRTPDDLRQHQIVTYRYQAEVNHWSFVTPDDQSITVPVAGSLTMNNSLAVREAVLDGAGIARIPTFVVGDDIRHKRLRPLLTGYATLEVRIYCVYPERRYLSPKVRAFIEFLAERFGDTPYWDQTGS